MDLNLIAQRQRRWQQLLVQIEQEYRQLAAKEQAWLAERLAAIAALQQQLQRLFLQVDGARACHHCHGDCCATGHNHMTLANLLGYLQQGQFPPPADFSAPCPFLGGAGCQLAVEWRPYNCISFICDIIEDRLTSAEVKEYYRLEKSLRDCYQQFAARYAGGGMTGLLLQQQRLGTGGFLRRKGPSV